MIRSFEIRNFKAFRDVTLQLGQLVLLSGVNSSGKSSVLQAIRLAELAMTHGPTVQLNQLMGLELGEATDVLKSGSASAAHRVGCPPGRWGRSAPSDRL